METTTVEVQKETKTNGQEVVPFVIETGVQKKHGRGPHAVKDPKFLAMKETMKRMERGNSFVFPLNGTKPGNVKNWIKKIQKSMNDNLLDPKMRLQQPIQFSSETIKDALGVQTGVRIFRDN